MDITITEVINNFSIKNSFINIDIFKTFILEAFTIFSTPSFIFAYKKNYIYFNIIIKLFPILPKKIITIYNKTFVKTADLVYFSRLEKYGKI